MGRPRSFDEGSAVAAAIHLFCERGYDGTSVDDVERAPTDPETAALVSAGLDRVRSGLPADADLAQVLGEHLIARAAPRSVPQEDM